MAAKETELSILTKSYLTAEFYQDDSPSLARTMLYVIL